MNNVETMQWLLAHATVVKPYPNQPVTVSMLKSRLALDTAADDRTAYIVDCSNDQEHIAMIVVGKVLLSVFVATLSHVLVGSYVNPTLDTWAPAALKAHLRGGRMKLRAKHTVLQTVVFQALHYGNNTELCGKLYGLLLEHEDRLAIVLAKIERVWTTILTTAELDQFVDTSDWNILAQAAARHDATLTSKLRVVEEELKE